MSMPLFPIECQYERSPKGFGAISAMAALSFESDAAIPIVYAQSFPSCLLAHRDWINGQISDSGLLSGDPETHQQ